MKKHLLAVSILLCVTLFTYAQVAGDYQTTASGLWNDITKWQRHNGSSWVAATDYPGQNTGTGTVTILNGNNIDLNVSPANAIGALTIASGGTTTSFSIGSAVTLNVTGATTINAPSSGANNQKLILLGNAGAQFNCASLNIIGSTNNNRQTHLQIVSGTVSVTGNITMGTNPITSFIDFTGGTLNVGGNISGGTISAGTGTVNLNGSGAQSLSTIYKFYNLIVNKSGGVLTLATNDTIANTLTLTNGKINTATNNLVLSNTMAGSQLSGGSANSYVYSTGTGRLRRNSLLISDGYVLFPVGTSGNYLPVEIRHNDITPADIAVSVFSPATTNGVEGGSVFSNTSYMVNAVWNIDKVAGSAFGANIRIHWDNALEGSNFSSFTDGQIGISHYVGGWQTATAISASQSGNTVEEVFTSFSPFGVTQIGMALPVKFGPFKAYEKQNGIQLEWKVYTEDKVKEYVIERAADARLFHGIGSTPAVFNTVGSGDYGFFDTDPLPGRSFYRLKNVDIDGKSSYSPVIMVNRDKSQKGLRLYPNPVANGIIALQGSDLAKGMYKLTVLNTAGQEIQTQYFGHTGGTIAQTFDLSAKLGKGIYLLVVKDEDGNQLMKEKFVNQ